MSYHVNSDSAQGKDLRERFNIRGIPTFVFVDEDGSEIDRIIGFMPPKEYLAEMTRIRNGINTVPDLINRLETEPENVELLKTLAGKIEVMSGLKGAIGYWELIYGLDEVESTVIALAGLKMSVFHSSENKDPVTLESFLRTETDQDVLPEAYEALRGLYRSWEEKDKEADVYRRYVNFMVDLKKETPGFLNGYAWRMTQLEMNLENALERADQAIALFTEEDNPREIAQIMDTKAEVLWKLDRIDEAVLVMDECIVLQPEDEYYKEQKAKFLATE